MAKVTPIQESFAAGEISPKLLGRRSIEGYRAGAQQMYNMIADSRGPAIGRRGFRFAQAINGTDIRLGTITVGANTGYLFLITDLLLTITGILGELPDENAILNGAFADQGDNWIVTTNGAGSSVIFNVGSAVINSGEVTSARIAQQFNLAAVGTHTLILESDANTFYKVKIGDNENSSEYYELLSNTARIEVAIDIQSTTPWITIERDAANLDPGGINTITVFKVTVTDDVSQLTFTAPWAEAELRGLYFVQSPDGESVYMLHRNHEPYKLAISAGVLTFGPVVFTAPPAQWGPNNYPGAGAIFEGRLWLGGAPLQAQTFWGSKAGAVEDFTLGENPDDSLEFTISKFGAIVWMMGTKNLLIGTVSGEYVVSSESGVITPTDVQIDQQSAYGSSSAQPVQVGDQVFYVSLDGTKVRAMQYEWAANNWLSKDLTFFSEHITASGIREMSWAPNPNNLLICTLVDGTMAWLSYERGENVWGWHKHVTDGSVLDSVTGVVAGLSFTAVGVARRGGEIFIETLFEQSQVHMDSWVAQQTSQEPFTIVTGLDHLEGKIVQVVANGAVAPDKLVTGGEIVLDDPAIRAVVGLQYIPKLVTLPLESGAPTGSSLAYLKRYNRMIVGLLDSALPLINGVRPPDRSPATPMNTIEPNRTGQINAYQLGWSEGAIITVEQDLPLAITVVYIGGELPQDVL